MAEPIEIASIIIATIFGGVGTGFGIYNFVKAFLVRPKPTIIRPVITESFTDKHPQRPIERVLRFDFEVRNNGDTVTRLYLNGFLEVNKNYDRQPKDKNGNFTTKAMMLEPHSIKPTHLVFYLPEKTKIYDEGTIEFGHHYFNYKNKYRDFKQLFSFKKIHNTWFAEEIELTHKVKKLLRKSIEIVE
ncbi:MAG: hypothetical protein ACTSQN_12170 [Candidatus Heimdallarchaeota archaeon]